MKGFLSMGTVLFITLAIAMSALVLAVLNMVMPTPPQILVEKVPTKVEVMVTPTPTVATVSATVTPTVRKTVPVVTVKPTE